MSTSTDADLHGRRIFIVEDDMRINTLIEECLSDLGCHVVGIAMLLDDALDMSALLPFDVALLDLSLNGELSYPVAQAMLDRNQKFVFVTGYVMDTFPAQFQGTPVLRKPFGIRDLQETLRTALSAKLN